MPLSFGTIFLVHRGLFPESAVSFDKAGMPTALLAKAEPEIEPDPAAS